MSLKLEDTENWLYEDGEDQSKQVYIDKLAELKVIIAVEIIFFPPLTGRHYDFFNVMLTVLATETWAAHPGEVYRG